MRRAGYADACMKANPRIKVEITAIASGDVFAKLAAMATDTSSLPTLYFTSGNRKQYYEHLRARELSGVPR